jgi:peptide/nickel transport system substrate-binding protein
MDSVDPGKQVASLAGAMLMMVFDTLTKVTPDGTLVPSLATSWSVSDDHLTWTFKLRQGVTFHDGTPFDSKAVETSWARVLDPANALPARNNMPNIASLATPDPYTFSVTTTTPNSALPLLVSQTTAMIISPRSISTWGNDLGLQQAAGTGPFKITGLSVPTRVELTRNDQYWGDAPKLQHFTFVSVSDAETRLNMLRTGEANLDFYLNPNDLSVVQSDPSLTLLTGPAVRVFTIALPLNLPELSDLRVRQALNYAVNRNQIVDTVYGGNATVADSSVQLGIGYKPLEQLPYDTQKAATLFSDAGWTPGPDHILQKGGSPFPTLKLEASNGQYPGDAQLAQAVQGYLAAAGVPVQLQTDPFSAFLPIIRQRAMNPVPPEVANTMIQIALGYTTMDAGNYLCQAYKSGGQVNYSGYGDAYMDDQCNAIAAAFDQDQRNTLIATTSKKVYDDLPAIYLLIPKYIAVEQAGLDGVVLHPSESHVLAWSYWR